MIFLLFTSNKPYKNIKMKSTKKSKQKNSSKVETVLLFIVFIHLIFCQYFVGSKMNKVS